MSEVVVAVSEPMKELRGGIQRNPVLGIRSDLQVVSACNKNSSQTSRNSKLLSGEIYAWLSLNSAAYCWRPLKG